jgi:hypothetical protein
VTCHRRYTFTFPVEVGHKHVQLQLEQACQTYWWYSEPKVRGNGLGVLQVEFQVAARDQWWAHKRAMSLMERAVYSLGLDIPVPTPEWEVLPPHSNRGRYRVPQ